MTCFFLIHSLFLPHAMGVDSSLVFRSRYTWVKVGIRTSSRHTSTHTHLQISMSRSAHPQLMPILRKLTTPIHHLKDSCTILKLKDALLILFCLTTNRLVSPEFH